MNIVYSTGMPFEGENLIDGYILLIIKYAVFKLYITSVGNKNITRDDVVDVIALSSRYIDHNKEVIDILCSELKN